MGTAGEGKKVRPQRPGDEEAGDYQPVEEGSPIDLKPGRIEVVEPPSEREMRRIELAAFFEVLELLAPLREESWGRILRAAVIYYGVRP